MLREYHEADRTHDVTRSKFQHRDRDRAREKGRGRDRDITPQSDASSECAERSLSTPKPIPADKHYVFDPARSAAIAVAAAAALKRKMSVSDSAHSTDSTERRGSDASTVPDSAHEEPSKRIKLGSRLMAYSHAQITRLVLQLAEKKKSDPVFQHELIQLLPQRVDTEEIEREVNDALGILAKIIPPNRSYYQLLSNNKQSAGIVQSNGSLQILFGSDANHPDQMNSPVSLSNNNANKNCTVKKPSQHRNLALNASVAPLSQNPGDSSWFRRSSGALARIKAVIFKHSTNLIQAGLYADYITFFAPLALQTADILPIWDDPKHNKLPQTIYRRVAASLRVAIARCRVTDLETLSNFSVAVTAQTENDKKRKRILQPVSALSIAPSDCLDSQLNSYSYRDHDEVCVNGEATDMEGLCMDLCASDDGASATGSVSCEDLRALMRVVKACRGYETERGDFRSVAEAVEAILDGA
ncbi:hypothetical protein HDU77_003188 [Chytriomyces hyalinus]|nr:hypothetical protein HDU77_003188 [Chytriomyces hyalinus]